MYSYPKPILDGNAIICTAQTTLDETAVEISPFHTVENAEGSRPLWCRAIPWTYDVWGASRDEARIVVF